MKRTTLFTRICSSCSAKMKKIVMSMAMLLVVLLAVSVVYADFPCGSGKCKSGESCCDNSACCPSGKNIYCSNSNKCWDSVSAAQKDCGNDYTICASSAAGKKQEVTIEAASICPGKETKSMDAFEQFFASAGR